MRGKGRCCGSGFLDLPRSGKSGALDNVHVIAEQKAQGNPTSSEKKDE